MIQRLKTICRRYETAHARFAAAPRPIRDRLGRLAGYVDLIEVAQGRLRVAGWVRAEKVSLRLAGQAIEAAPVLRRPDVANRLGGPETVGFDLSLPADGRILAAGPPPELVVTVAPGQGTILPLSLPIRVSVLRAARLRLRFLRDLAGAVPDILRWRATGDLACRNRIKTRLRLDAQPAARRWLEPRLFRGQGATEPVRPQRLTIVLPVYNAFDLLAECLDRLARHTDLPCRLILVEDGSSDARVRPFLRDWVAGRDWAELLENPRNLGFVGAVNRGLGRAMAADGEGEGPVVLLNSDALVPQGWASRLLRPFQRHEGIATVTPMSNDAEILSVPMICRRGDLEPGQGDAIDAVARQFAPEALLSEVPTGIGFCMAIGRDWLRRTGLLDPAFGRGYGEEVDWCQRALRAGGRHLALPGLFVEHRGGQSFGAADKQRQILANHAIIQRRYPDYDQSVQDFIAADPLAGARLALGLAWIGSRQPGRAVPVYLAHSLGGGADLQLEQRMQADLEAGLSSVVLRVGGGARWRLELVTPLGRSHGDSDDIAAIRRLLACLPRRRLVYSCGVGDPDPVALPAMLLSLLAEGDEAELLFHDYLPLSPSYTLLDGDGIYRGPVQASRDDPAHVALRPDGGRVPLRDWQAAWKAFAARAEIVAFSQNSARLVAAAWPDLQGRITVRPHGPRCTILPHLPARGGAPMVLGVLGNIGLQKGAGVLRDLAAQLDGRADAPRLVLIGNIDPAFALPPSVCVHGSYAIEDLTVLTGRYGITHWLIPSIWPETFCFAVHEALATRLPVMAFGIGAQGDAVRMAANGIEIPFMDGRGLAARVVAVLDGLGADPVRAPVVTVR